jgi:tetratricopeptide (TPR) repeat protein
MSSDDRCRFLCKLGQGFMDQGVYNKALEQWLQCLDIHIETFGKGHEEVANMHAFIAHNFYAERQYETALQHYTLCVEIQVSLGDYVSTVYPRHHIGMILCRRKLYDEAFVHLDFCLDIKLKVLGGGHEEVSDAYYSVGMLLQHQSVHDQAFEYFQKCLVIRLDVFGCQHANVGVVYFKMGINSGTDRSTDKLMYYQKAEDIFLKVLKEDSQHILVMRYLTLVYEGIGNCFCASGQLPEAIFSYQKCLDLTIERLGSNHVDVAKLYVFLGECYLDQKLTQEALVPLEKSLTIYTNVLGNQDATTVNQRKSVHCVRQTLKTEQELERIDQGLLQKIRNNTDHCCAALGCQLGGVMQCSACKSVYYCSQKCQKSHWKIHRKKC